MIQSTPMTVLFHNLLFNFSVASMVDYLGYAFDFSKAHRLLLVSISLVLCYLHFETILESGCFYMIIGVIRSSPHQFILSFTQCTHRTVHTLPLLIHALKDRLFI